jgi:hypothetical protein
MAKGKPTKAERNLLRHPPTQTTWECRRKLSSGEKCGTLNPGRSHACCLCRGAKPARPKLVWPAYLAACEKIGHKPGERWPVKPPSEAQSSRAGARPKRKGNR